MKEVAPSAQARCWAIPNMNALSGKSYKGVDEETKTLQLDDDSWVGNSLVTECAVTASNDKTFRGRRRACKLWSMSPI